MKWRRIDIYVPETHAEQVKDAVFEAGGGGIGNYDRCCFQIMGIGQFRPLDGANPFLGSAGKVEYVAECKLEVICPDEKIQSVIAAIRKAHPYETPAFQHWIVELE